MEQEKLKSTWSAAAILALRRGDKIEAIKIARKEHGLGLKEAKDLVEAYLRTNPSDLEIFSANQGESRQRALWWVAVVLACAVLAYAFLAKK